MVFVINFKIPIAKRDLSLQLINMSPAKEMFISTLHERGALLLFIAVIFSASYIYPRLRVRQRLKQIPLMGEELGGYYKRRNEFLRDPMRFYWEGYQRCKNKCFRVTHYEGQLSLFACSTLSP